jgi:outer membrane beta-barrel protein
LSAFALPFALAASLSAAPPEFEPDPFQDADFDGAPLILDVAHPTRGRADASLMFVTSVIDKYSSHTGGMLDLSYHVVDTLGIGVSFGYMHGQLTNIVTDAQGIIGNKMQKCDALTPPNCSNINPDVPDYRQITGVLDLVAIWSPLYGKVNVVSELDVNLQLYGLLGGGVNGTRTINASAPRDPAGVEDFQLEGGQFGEGGVFDDMFVNVTFGAGLRIFMLDRVALKAEFRALTFYDEFDFDRETEELEGYWSMYYFSQLGLAFRLF